MPTTITDSPNIALLDSKVTGDLCSGIFEVDISPSVFIGTAANILGASIQIKNLSNNTTVKNYPSAGYDILPPFTTKVVTNIPTISGTYQYGKYQFDVKLFDEEGRVYEVSKSQNFCAPDNKRKKYGTLSAELNASCLEEKLYVSADSTPVYSKAMAESQVNAFTLEYPTHSTLPVLNSTVSKFNVTLFEGVYIFKGESCVTYSLGDNIFAKVKYKYKREKQIFCRLNKECISASLVELLNNFREACTVKEKSEIMTTVMQVLLLVQGIEATSQSGFDPSDLISELQDILGCQCTCNCDDGAPLNGGLPAADVIIEGCGIETEVTGLTTTYRLPNRIDKITVTDNGGALIAQNAVTTNCVTTQNLVLNIPVLYSKIKGLVTTPAESAFWGSVINKQWDGWNPECIGLTSAQWATMTWRERSFAVFAGVCAGGVCNAKISSAVTRVEGSNVILSWVNISGVFEAAVYIDNILVGTILAPSQSGEFTAIGFADGKNHRYDIISKCQNGSIGQSLYGNFEYFGCPTIAPVVLTNNNITAACPYNLTSVVGSVPSGTVAEWHSQNNNNPQSIVANPSQVSAGVYYVFAKDSNGCYSVGTAFTLVCATGNCTAPQGLIAEAITGGTRVRFNSASYPPPSNSYTIKRRLASLPDVAGSYTTIGTPTFNASANKWEILDNSAEANKAYVYRAISNCGSTAPYVDITFANLPCFQVTYNVTTP